MNKAILLSLAAAATLATAAPAVAQGYDRQDYGQPSGYAPPPPSSQYDEPQYRQPDYGRAQFGPARFGGDVNDRIGFLYGRIDQSQRQGMINEWQGRRLRGQLSQVRWMAQRYRGQNGGRLNDWQRAQLNQRLDGVAGQLRFDRW